MDKQLYLDKDSNRGLRYWNGLTIGDTRIFEHTVAGVQHSKSYIQADECSVSVSHGLITQLSLFAPELVVFEVASCAVSKCSRRM